MKPKEYLSQAYKIDRRIKIIRAKIDKINKSADECNVPDNTRDKIKEYEDRSNKLVSLLVDKRIEIDKAIQAVDDDIQREVLERRYLLYQRWDTYYDEISGEYVKGIADSMGYSQRQIYRIHGEALKKIKMSPNGSF